MKSLLKNLLVARAIIEAPEEKILLLKRKSERTYNPGLWELPGGKVNEFENIELAIERLIRKEAKLYVKLIPDRHYLHSRVVVEEGKYRGFTYIEITVPTVYLAGDIVLNNEDHEAMEWVTLDKVLSYELTPEGRKTLSQYIYDKRHLKDSEPRITVVSRALILDDEGRILLLKRSHEHSFGGLWELPGGKLQSFESLDDHMVREVLEETGCVVTIVKPSLYLHVYIPKDGCHKGETFFNIINQAKVKSGKLRLSSEHQEYKWVTKDEIWDYELAGYMNLALTEILERLV